MKLMKTIIKSIFLLGAIAFLSCSTDLEANQETVEYSVVRVQKVTSRDLTIEKTFYGETRFKQSQNVVAELSGQVKQINVEPGQQVKKGEVLLCYPPQNYHLQTEQAELAYNELKRNYDKQLALLEKGAVSQQSVDQLKAELDIQEKVLTQAKEEYCVKAPFSGTITDLAISPGKEILPGDQLLSIANTSTFEVDFYVTQSDINNTTQGSSLRLLFENDTVFGFVSRKALIMDPVKRAFRVRGEFNNSSAANLVGQTAELIVSLQTISDAVLIPSQAVKTQGGETYVFINQNNKAIKTSIGTKQIVGLEIVVSKGLATGDELIVAGIDKLEKNPLIKVVESLR